MRQVWDMSPDGHPKLLHLWPVKLLQAGRVNYDGSDVMAMRAAASLSPLHDTHLFQPRCGRVPLLTNLG